MTYKHWTIILGAIAMVFGFVFLVSTTTTAKQQSADEDLSVSLSVAMGDASAESEWDIDKEGGRLELVHNIEDRLGEQLNRYSEEYIDEMMLNIPCIAILDYNGFYLYYTSRATMADGSKQFVKVMSAFMPYQIKKDGYIVTMSLKGDITIKRTGQTGYLYTGDSIDAYARADGNPEVQKVMKSLGFVTRNRTQTQRQTDDQASYETILGHIIVQYVKESMETLVTREMYGKNAGNLYTFDVPTTSDSPVRTVTHPTVMALYQGDKKIQSSETGGTTNVYSFVAAEISLKEQFYVSTLNNGYTELTADGTRYKPLFYHKKGCTHNTADESYTGSDKTEPVFIGSKRQCAEYGANPCPYCTMK